MKKGNVGTERSLNFKFQYVFTILPSTLCTRWQRDVIITTTFHDSDYTF